MNEKLFPYQQESVDWISKRRFALLAHEMGLGKSAIAITAADKINAQRILVVCPAVARVNWLREFAKFSKKARQFSILARANDVFRPSDSLIVSYDLGSRISPSTFGFFDLIILDEVHYLKNPGAKRTASILGKRGIIHGQQSQARSKDTGTKTKIWVLSGTPAPNHAGELWPLLYTFGVTTLKYDDFIQRFCNIRPSAFGRQIQIAGTKKSRIQELRGLLAGVMLRTTKKEVGDQLPPISYSTIVVEEGKVDLTQESSFVQYTLNHDGIKELEAKLKAELLQVKNAISTNNVRLLEGLAKSVSTLRRYVGIQKVEKTVELVTEELRNGLYNKIVIFAIHRDVIEGLRVRLGEFNPVTLYGGTRFDSAHKHIDKFQNFPKFRVFIGNITACGIAINLTAAHNVLMLEQEWTPASNAQAIARCHRYGQTNPVVVRMVGLANSLDEKIVQILKRKTEELTEIFDGDKHPRQITFQELIQ